MGARASGAPTRPASRRRCHPSAAQVPFERLGRTTPDGWLARSQHYTIGRTSTGLSHFSVLKGWSWNYTLPLHAARGKTVTRRETAETRQNNRVQPVKGAAPRTVPNRQDTKRPRLV